MSELLQALEADAESYVASAATRRTFVHAGVVGWRGRALLLPGSSGSGKSTLVQALVHAGARYYSDEFALLDDDGRVHPFPRPLALREHEGALPVPVPGGSLRAGRRPLPVGLVAFLAHRPGRDLRLRPLSPGHAALNLLAHTLPARLRPEAALAVISRCLSGVPAFEGVRGEAGRVAARLLALMDEEAAR